MTHMALTVAGASPASSMWTWSAPPAPPRRSSRLATCMSTMKSWPLTLGTIMILRVLMKQRKRQLLLPDLPAARTVWCTPQVIMHTPDPHPSHSCNLHASGACAIRCYSSTDETTHTKLKSGPKAGCQLINITVCEPICDVAIDSRLTCLRQDAAQEALKKACTAPPCTVVHLGALHPESDNASLTSNPAINPFNATQTLNSNPRPQP